MKLLCTKKLSNTSVVLVKKQGVSTNIRVDRVLIEVQRVEMCRPVTIEEVKNAMFSVDSAKAPGTDGYNAAFFKRNWASGDCWT